MREDFGGGVGIDDHRALGDFEFEPTGFQLRLIENFGDDLHQVGIRKLTTRNVYRDRHRGQTRVLPGLVLSTRFVENPAADL